MHFLTALYSPFQGSKYSIPIRFGHRQLSLYCILIQHIAHIFLHKPPLLRSAKLKPLPRKLRMPLCASSYSPFLCTATAQYSSRSVFPVSGTPSAANAFVCIQPVPSISCVLLLCSTVHVVRRFPVSSTPLKLRMPLYASSLFSFRVSLLLSGRVLWRVANYLLTDTKHGQSTGLCSVINQNLATSLSVLRRTTKAGVVC